MHASFTVDNYGKATVVFDGYTERPITKDNVHQRRCPQVTNKVDISIATQFVGKKNCLANNIHKQALIKLIANCMQQKGCHIIHAEGDADVDIAKAAIAASSYSSTTVIRKDTELLGLLLYYYEELDSNDLYFRSDKDRITPYVYNIRILKQLLGHEFSCNLLFGHAFSGSNTASQIFGVGKKTIFHRAIKGNPLLRECSEIFCTAGKDLHSIEDHGCRLMVSLFNGTQSDSLESL